MSLYSEARPSNCSKQNPSHIKTRSSGQSAPLTQRQLRKPSRLHGVRNKSTRYLEYAIGVLQVLCEDSNVIDPSDALGFKVDSGKAYVNPEYKQERIKTLYRTQWNRPDMYHGVAKVIQLLMTIRPEQFPMPGRKSGPPDSSEMGSVHRVPI